MKGQKNSERFLTAFNRIEHRLRDLVGAKNYMPFYRLLQLSIKKTAIVKKYQDELRTFADLRNAIIHNRTKIEYVIAEPHFEVVRKIEEIERQINRPRTVFQLYRKSVQTFQLTDSLLDVLRCVHENKYTQFPVYQGKKFIGLLTTVGITNWMADVSKDGKVPLHWPTLQQIPLSAIDEPNYRFIARDTSVIAAEEIFKNNIARGKRIEALLITEHGKPEQKLLGIVTPMDIVEKI